MKNSRYSTDNNEGCFIGCFFAVVIGIFLLVIAYYGAILWLAKYAIDSFS